MLALCLMLFSTYYAQNYASIIGSGLLSALPLFRSHIPVVCNMSLMILCCYKVLWSMIHWIYLSIVFWAWLPLFGQPFHYLQEREGLLRDGLLFVIFYRDTLQSNIWLSCSIVVTIMLHTVYDVKNQSNQKKFSYMPYQRLFIDWLWYWVRQPKTGTTQG